MLSSSKLAERRREDEIMDDPDLDAGRHAAALQGLARLNLLAGAARLVWEPIADLARTCRLRQLSVLDVATGAGDIPLALSRRAAKTGLQLEIQGVDISPRAIDHARRRARAAGAQIEFQQLDVLHDPLPPVDVITCSLFLHHLSYDEGRKLLASMAAAARRLVVISDLLRNRRGLWLTQLAVRLCTSSDVVRVDGPRSVRAAFSLDEARQLAEAAGLAGATVRRRWPSRYVLTWNPPGEERV